MPGLDLRSQRKLKPEDVEKRTKAKLEADEKEHEAVRAEQVKQAAARAQQEEKEREEDKKEAEELAKRIEAEEARLKAERPQGHTPGTLPPAGGRPPMPGLR